MTPDIYDWDWVRGTTEPIIMRFKLPDGNPIPFDDVRLRVYNGSTFLFMLSISEGGATVTDALTGEVTFQPTAAQTRQLVPSQIGSPGKNKYEIELRNGASELVYVLGTISGIGGLNDDEVTS